MEFAAPEGDSLEQFHRIVREEYGIPCTVRQEKGQVGWWGWLWCVHVVGRG